MRQSDPVTITSALISGFTSIASDAMSALVAVLPVALPILGAIVVIGISLKAFKKVTGR